MQTQAVAKCVIKCQLGQREAFDYLIDYFYDRVQRYVLHMLDRSRYDDVIQEIWVRVFRGIVKVKNPKAFEVWLFRVCRGVVMSQIKSKYKDQQILHVENIDQKAANQAKHLLDELIDKEQLEQLQKAIQNLSESHREVVTLFHISQFSIVKISEILKVSQGTVKSRLYRARIILSQSLEGASS